METSGKCDTRLIRAEVCALLMPPDRLSVSDAATKILRISTPGGYQGPWDRSVFPYMIEPMDAIRSRLVEAVVFIGPAQSGKTFSLLGGGIAHAACYDPADQIVIQMTQDSARDWSRKELDRWIRASPELTGQMSTRPRDDNTFDKFWRSGAICKIGWPSVTQLSSKAVRDVFLTDYDRMPDDIDGEGSAFGLARQRTKTYRTRGITVAESSPGRDLPNELAKWKPSSPHEPPPVGGIVGLYAGSNRKRWYWPCPHCGEYWEPAPGIGLFRLPDFAELLGIVKSDGVASIVDRYSRPVCPHCNTAVDAGHKRAMNLAGYWLAAGEKIDREGRRTGRPLQSTIDGYWLGGIAAAFQDWPAMIEKYAQAVLHYGKTSEVHLLKQTVNTDQAAPFAHPAKGRDLQQLGELQSIGENFDRGTVPPWVRFLIGTVDVQVGMFVCQIFGISPMDGGGWEWTIVDRFLIKESGRTNELGERAQVNPAAYVEDWERITREAIMRKYGEMGVVFTLIDSGGSKRAGQGDSEKKQSVTEKAYAYWRSLQSRGLGARVRLVKGRKDSRSRVEETWPDTRKQGGASRGDVPVLMIATDILKDALAADLERAAEGNGGARWADWLPADVIAEMTAETRTDKGWVKPSGARNEATDLAVYMRAGCIYLGLERPDFWDRPPIWVTTPLPSPVRQATPQRGRSVRSRGTAI